MTGLAAGDTADLVVRAQRAWVDGTFRPAAVVVHDGRISRGPARRRGRRRRAGPTPCRTGRCCSPDSSTPTCTSTSPAAPSGRASRRATRAAAPGGVTTIVDMPLNSIPPTTTVEALAVKRAAPGPRSRSTSGSGAARSPRASGRSTPLHDAGVFGFKCFLAPSRRRRVPAPRRPSSSEPRSTRSPRSTRLLIVHAEDPEHLRAAPSARRPTTPTSWPPGPSPRRRSAIAQVIDGVRGDRCARAHPAPVRRAARCRCSVRRRPRGSGSRSRPARTTSSFDGEHDPRRRDRSTSAARRSATRPTATRCGQALLDGTIDLVVSDHSPSTAELKFAGDGDFGRPGAGSRACRSGSPRCGPRPTRRGHPARGACCRCSRPVRPPWSGCATAG